MSYHGSRDVLVLKRVLNASIERVFDAWTNPEMLSQWFGPVGFSVIKSDVQLHVGGSYGIEICSPDSKCIKHFGTYIKISRPHKLTFTWMLADQDCTGGEDIHAETLVSIEFKSVDQGTELTLTHEQLPSKKSYDGHKFGWTSSLDSLTSYFQ